MRLTEAELSTNTHLQKYISNIPSLTLTVLQATWLSLASHQERRFSYPIQRHRLTLLLLQGRFEELVNLIHFLVRPLVVFIELRLFNNETLLHA